MNTGQTPKPIKTETLISIQEAKKIIRENTSLLKKVLIPLEKSIHHILAENIIAPWDIPGFRQSSVDGYALCYEDFQKENRFYWEGESAAGNPDLHILKPHQAERVFTGAPIPEGADTVIMQEKVEIQGKELKILDQDFERGNQVRAIGSEIKSGTLAMKAGHFLNPASLGFLAGIGISEVWVYPKPRISLLITGNELQSPGKSLDPGKVFESSSYSVNAALEYFHFPQASLHFISDNLEEMTKAVKACLNESDIILITGGVSVGDYDFTPQSLHLNHFQTLFHKVKQRPGKPFLFAKKEETLAFGLPGNPGSVLTCFYQYIVPALEILSGIKNLVPEKKAILEGSYKKIKGLSFFVRGQYHEGKVKPLGAQESYKMGSYSEANCLIEMEEEKEWIAEGEELKIYEIP